MVRHINGGFRYCKAMAVELKERGIVQVSMNLTDYSKTAIYRVFETIKMEARRFRRQCPGQRDRRARSHAGARRLRRVLPAAGEFLL